MTGAKQQGHSHGSLARILGVRQESVSEAIRNGRLEAALYPDRSIRDLALAEKLFKESSTGNKRQAAPTLAAARLRKLLSQVEKFESAVGELRQTCIRPSELKTMVQREMAPVLKRLRRIPDCGPRAAGLDDGEAHILIRAEVIAAFEDITAAPEPEATPRSPPRKVKRPTTAVEIDALRTSLSAELQEYENALASGEVIRIDDAIADQSDRLARLRSALLILPGRVASRLGRLDARGAKALLSAEVESALREGGFK